MMIITVFVIYLVVLLGIAVLAERTMSKTREGFYLGDRRIGPIGTALSAGSTDTSGWIFIGAAGFAYSYGLSTMWMLPGFIIGYIINYLVVAPRPSRFTARKDCYTLGDFFARRLGDNGRVLRGLTGLIIICFFTGYIAAQFTAAGKALDTLLGFDYVTAIWLAAAFVAAYVLIGGYKAVVWTDVMQGSIMLLVLIVFPAFLILELGGWSDFFAQAGAIDAKLLDPLGQTGGAAGVAFVFGLFASGLAEPGQPQILQRFFTAKDDETVRQASVIGMFWVIVVMTGSNLLGIAGRIMVPEIPDAEFIFPQLVMDRMPAIAAGIVLAAIMAAIMSSVDSQIMIVTQSFNLDILRGVFGYETSERQAIWIARAVIAVIGLLGALFAVADVRAVFWFVFYAWSGLGASFAPVVLLGLYWRGLTKEGAIASMVVGTVVTVIWYNVPGLKDVIYEFAPAVVLSTIACVVVSRMTRAPADAEALLEVGSVPDTDVVPARPRPMTS